MATKPKLTPVESSNIAAVGYQPKKKVLTVQFLNGAEYTYEGVPPAINKALMAAESKGKYLNAAIKGTYDYKQIKPPADKKKSK